MRMVSEKGIEPLTSYMLQHISALNTALFGCKNCAWVRDFHSHSLLELTSFKLYGFHVQT